MGLDIGLGDKKHARAKHVCSVTFRQPRIVVTPGVFHAFQIARNDNEEFIDSDKMHRRYRDNYRTA